MHRQIIALGGKGFPAETDNLALDAYILLQAPNPRPSVCFLGTASGDAEAQLLRFYQAFCRLDCHPRHLALFGPTPPLKDFLLRQDVLLVGGGSTRSLLGVWQAWGLPDLLQEAWERGVVLAGTGAGAVCWFQTALADAWEGEPEPLPGLGFLPGACCPRYDAAPERRQALLARVQAGTLPDTLALDTGTAAHFTGTELKKVVASRPRARGHRAALTPAGEAKVLELPAEVLEPA